MAIQHHSSKGKSMKPGQQEKAQKFQDLHRAGTFVIPNPWDIGTARLLAMAGFQALATTSAGYAFARGLPDNAIGREQMMLHLQEMAAATELPLSADLENGFGDAPEFAAQTILMAAEAGVVGGSIEDATNRPDDPLYSLEFAAERVCAAAEAKSKLPFPFTLTARAENYLNGKPDIKDTIRRLQAYQEAGADVLFAPGIRTKEDIAAVVSSVDRPVNVVMGLVNCNLNLEQLAALGVRRVSVGGSLARAALASFLRAVHEIREKGSFSYANDAISGAEINGMFQSWLK
jgi:2-methylisocitrate lyase-like PEP mutase family enzyme